VSYNPDLFLPSVLLGAPSLAWPTGRLQFQIQIQSYQGRERLSSKNIDDILPCRLVSLRREKRRLFPLARLLADGELDACLDAGILTQNPNNTIPFPLDISLQLLPSYWEVVEQIFHYNSSSLLCRHHARSLELPRHLEFEFSALWCIFRQTCNDREMGERTERRQSLATKAKGL
jgi:hypothetical protein